jgi:hypothetical protein
MKTKTLKCEFCSADSAPELCKLATATTMIDGKKYTACCVKCVGKSAEEEPKKVIAKQKKK